MYRVLLAESLDETAERRLALGAQVVCPASTDEAALCAAIVDCDALVARTSTRVTRAVLQAGRKLRVVGVAGIGTDRVDLDAAAELGVTVLNTPAASTDAVADFTLALLLNLLRPVAILAGKYRRGHFDQLRAGPHGPELCELTIGVVGMGRIGTAVARRCAAAGARVIYNDILPVGPFDFPAEGVDKPTLWAASQVVTLHVPLTEQTRRLVDHAVLDQLQPGALLINTSRGAVVDTDDLVAALEDGRLGGAALDVVDPEPLLPEHPLFEIRNVILTPHVAARTYGGLRRMFGIVDAVLEHLASVAPDAHA